MPHYIDDDLRPGFNLALEQVLLRRAPCPAFMLWRNGPSVILGRHQSAAREVDLAEAARLGVAVHRRKSGGGAVYHDLGTINFSFFLPASDPVGQALLDFMALLGFPSLATERNDVLAGGRKIAGTAQLLCGRRRLFHGCLLYDTDLDALGRLLFPHPAKLARHGVQSVRARVANLREVARMPLAADGFLGELRRRASGTFAGPPQPVPPDWLSEAEALSSTTPFLPLCVSDATSGHD